MTQVGGNPQKPSEEILEPVGLTLHGTWKLEQVVQVLRLTLAYLDEHETDFLDTDRIAAVERADAPNKQLADYVCWHCGSPPKEAMAAKGYDMGVAGAQASLRAKAEDAAKKHLPKGCSGITKIAYVAAYMQGILDK